MVKLWQKVVARTHSWKYSTEIGQPAQQGIAAEEIPLMLDMIE